MSLAPYIHALGRGPSRARSLTAEEAEDAMRQILAGDAAPEAVGALLMLMRYRGETPEEIAGFARAARATLSDWSVLGPEGAVALDWPSYAAGRSRGLPLFLLSARLVAQSGVPVLLHGWNSHQNPVADVRSALDGARIAMAQTPDAARRTLASAGIVYVPLESMSPPLSELVRLRSVLGLRSAINTVLRVLNPAGARASVQGVFHPGYRELQRAAAALLDQPRAMVIKGGGGEFERHPGKAVEAFVRGERGDIGLTAPALVSGARRLADPSAGPGDLEGLWDGTLLDPFAAAVVRGTAALALLAAGRSTDLAQAETGAAALWAERRAAEAA